MSAAPATRRRARSALRALSTVLIVSGTLLLADAGATLLWQEPVSAVYHRMQQGELEDQLATLDQFRPSDVERRALEKLPDPKRKLAFAARSLDRGPSGFGQPQTDYGNLGPGALVVGFASTGQRAGVILGEGFERDRPLTSAQVARVLATAP